MDYYITDAIFFLGCLILDQGIYHSRDVFALI